VLAAVRKGILKRTYNPGFSPCLQSTELTDFRHRFFEPINPPIGFAGSCPAKHPSCHRLT
jgi:hypothetical protein